MQGYQYDKKDYIADQQLWTSLIGGDKVALGTLFDTYARQMLVYGFRICGDKALVKDAIQDIFIDLWQYRANLAPQVQVKFYLFRSIRRAVLKQMAAPHQNAADIDNLDAFGDPQPSAETDWVVSETEHLQSRRILKSLSLLSNREREVISLKYYSDLKIREIAAMLEISEQTVANTLHNALSKLRKHLVLLLLLGQLLFLKIF